MNESNIVELGLISEEVEYTLDVSNGIRKSVPQEEIIKTVYIAELLKDDNGIVQLRNQNVSFFDKAINEIAGKCLDKYPEIDNIVS